MPVHLEKSPLILVGAARSGTTYLTDLINCHSDVFITEETRVFVWAHKTIHELLHNKSPFFRRREEFGA